MWVSVCWLIRPLTPALEFALAEKLDTTCFTLSCEFRNWIRQQIHTDGTTETRDTQTCDTAHSSWQDHTQHMMNCSRMDDHRLITWLNYMHKWMKCLNKDVNKSNYYCVFSHEQTTENSVVQWGVKIVWVTLRAKRTWVVKSMISSVTVFWGPAVSSTSPLSLSFSLFCFLWIHL